MNKIMNGIKLVLIPIAWMSLGVIAMNEFLQYNNAVSDGIITNILSTNQLLFFIGMPTVLLFIIAGIIFLEFNLLNNKIDKLIVKEIK